MNSLRLVPFALNQPMSYFILCTACRTPAFGLGLKEIWPIRRALCGANVCARALASQRKVLVLYRLTPIRESPVNHPNFGLILQNLRRRLRPIGQRKVQGPTLDPEKSVTPQGQPVMVNRLMVNRGAPELFPASFILKKSFIRRRKRGVAPLLWARTIHSNSLKTNNLLSLMICPLNGI